MPVRTEWQREELRVAKKYRICTVLEVSLEGQDETEVFMWEKIIFTCKP